MPDPYRHTRRSQATKDLVGALDVLLRTHWDGVRPISSVFAGHWAIGGKKKHGPRVWIVTRGLSEELTWRSGLPYAVGIKFAWGLPYNPIFISVNDPNLFDRVIEIVEYVADLNGAPLERVANPLARAYKSR